MSFFLRLPRTDCNHGQTNNRRRQSHGNDYMYKESLVPIPQAYHSSRRSSIDSGVPSISFYQPPSLGGNSNLNEQEDFSDHPVEPTSIYYSTPPPPSVSRSFRSQTPSRTSRLRELEDANNSATKFNSVRDQLRYKINPSEDFGRNSIFSYGCFCCQCVRTSEVGITENFGEFDRVLDPGFYCLLWPLSDISARLTLVRPFTSGDKV